MTRTAPSGADLIAAIERRAHDEAIAIAIAAWRVHRTAVLADLVDALAPKCAARAIGGRAQATFQRAYLAATKQAGPEFAGALADGLGKNVAPRRDVSFITPGHDAKRHRAVLARIEALAVRPPDPRIARAVVDLIVRAPYSVEDGDAVYGKLIALAVELGDERAIIALRAVVERPIAKTRTVRAYLSANLPRAIEQIERAMRKRTVPAQHAKLAELVATLVGPAPAPSRASADLDALLAECLANPDDEAPRLVYADALLEQGNPRGELIQLQLRAGPPSEEDAKRAAAIIRKHEAEWIGDLKRVTKLRVYRRGFLDEAELLQGAAADPATWTAVAADPRIATVRTLHKGNASEQLYRSFVLSPATRSLREIDVPSTKLLRDLAAAKRPLDAVSIPSLSKDALAILGDVATSCGFRRLTFETTATPQELIEQLAAWPARAKFDELVAIPKHRVENAWRGADRTWLFAFERLAPVTRLGISESIYNNRIVVARVSKGVEVDVIANQDYLIVSLLKSKPPLPVTKLVIRGRPTVWFGPGDKFQRALDTLPAGVVELREAWAELESRRRGK